MHISIAQGVLVSSLAFTIACEGGGGSLDEDGSDGPGIGLCGLDGPTNIVQAPEYAGSDEPGAPKVSRAGERVLFSWMRSSRPTDQFLTEPCGDATVQLNMPDRQFLEGFQVETSTGPRIYAQSSAWPEIYLLDRPDERGADAPRMAIQLADDVTDWMTVSYAGHLLAVARHGDLKEPQYFAAGLGGRRYSVYAHDGGLASASSPIADELVSVFAWAPFESRPLLVLTEGGEVRSIDLDTGESTVLLTQVRFLSISPDRRRVVWQQIGDDVAEPVFLRDLEDGSDRPLGINDFAAQSWGRKEDAHAAGRWWWTADGAFVAQNGPDGAFVTVVRGDTGEAIEAPPHTGSLGMAADGYMLRRAEGAVLWHPAGGDLLTLHEGDATVSLVREDDERLFYSVRLPGDSDQSLWSLERATGTRTEVLPLYQSYAHAFLDDGRHVAALPGEDGRRTLTLFDLETGEEEILAEGVESNIVVAPEYGVYYLVMTGDEPGLWLAPIPPR